MKCVPFCIGLKIIGILGEWLCFQMPAFELKGECIPQEHLILLWHFRRETYTNQPLPRQEKNGRSLFSSSTERCRDSVQFCFIYLTISWHLFPPLLSIVTCLHFPHLWNMGLSLSYFSVNKLTNTDANNFMPWFTGPCDLHVPAGEAGARIPWKLLRWFGLFFCVCLVYLRGYCFELPLSISPREKLGGKCQSLLSVPVPFSVT